MKCPDCLRRSRSHSAVYWSGIEASLRKQPLYLGNIEVRGRCTRGLGFCGSCAAFTKQGGEIIKWEEWNEIRILCEGNHIRVLLNGEKRVDYADDNPKDATAEGFFGMQVHAGGATDVRWRNLRIKELP